MIFTNNKNSCDFQFVFKVKENNDAIKKKVLKWFLSKMDTIVEHNFDFNILINNNSDIITNNIVILLHVKNTHTLHINNFIYLFDNSYQILPEITNISIHGITTDAMKKEWWNYINGYSGFLYTIMYIKDINHYWKEVIEKSNTFQWDNYPPIL